MSTEQANINEAFHETKDRQNGDKGDQSDASTSKLVEKPQDVNLSISINSNEAIDGDSTTRVSDLKVDQQAVDVQDATEV